MWETIKANDITIYALRRNAEGRDQDALSQLRHPAGALLPPIASRSMTFPGNLASVQQPDTVPVAARTQWSCPPGLRALKLP